MALWSTTDVNIFLDTSPLNGEPPKTTIKPLEERATLPVLGYLESFIKRTKVSLVGSHSNYQEGRNTPDDEDEASTEDSLFGSPGCESKSLDFFIQINDTFTEIIDSLKINSAGFDGIRNEKILAEHVAKEFESLGPKEKDILFLWSTFSNRHDLLEPLYKINANIHSTIPNLGYNALHLAAYNGCVKSCEWLISNGVDINLTVDGITPLHCAIMENFLDCTKLLLSRGATLDDTVLDCAFGTHATDCLQHLLNECVKRDSHDENAASHSAVDWSSEKCVQLMISHFPKADLKTTTKLHLAAGNNLFECCQFLIDGVAELDAVDHKGRTALHVAAKARSSECVRILLNAGCAVNAKAENGRTPLHMAVSGDSPDVPAIDALKVLVKGGADVNASDSLGLTALHLVADNADGLKDFPLCIDHLIVSRADITARSRDGVSALRVICQEAPSCINAICRELDSSVDVAGHRRSDKQNIILGFNFSYLLHHSKAGHVWFLKTLEKEGQKHLLEHPLCQAFLHLHWRAIRKFYFCRLFAWFVFVTFLTAYVVYALAHECFNAALLADKCMSCFSKHSSINFDEICLKNFTKLNGTSEKISTKTLEMCLNNFTMVENSAAKYVWIQARCLNNSAVGSFLIKSTNFMLSVWRMLVIMAVFESMRKIFILLCQSSKKYYVFQLDNIFEWFVVLSVFLVCGSWYGEIRDWQKIVGGIAVLLGWADFMIMIGQLPIFGTYVAMFTRVQTEFFKLLLVYSCLLVGFTASLCVLFPSDSAFRNPSVGFVKILAMMTGDLDFGIIERNLDSKASKFLNLSAYVTYAFFLVFVTVVLVTLLTGIAVRDIQGLHRTACLSKLIRQMELIYSLEVAIYGSFLPERLVQRLLTLLWRRVEVNPNFHLPDDELPKEVLMAALNLVKQKQKWTETTCCWLNTIRNCADCSSIQDENNSSEELRELKKLVQAQSEMISKLMKNNCDDLSENRYIKLQENLYEELRQLKEMVAAQNSKRLETGESLE